MRGWLLSLYPKQWREQYGDEYEVLLEDIGLSPLIVIDIIKAACLTRLYYHQKVIASAIAITLYTLSGFICLRLGLTANWPLWAPTKPARALGLLITLIPLTYMAQLWLLPIYKRLREHHGRTRATLNFLILLPLSATSIIFSAWTGGSFLIGLGLLTLGLRNGPDQPPPEIRLALVFMIVPLGLLIIKLLIALQQRLLEHLTT